jgi:23S rRNA (cytosine1962-C5)-methyltransferase
VAVVQLLIQGTQKLWPLIFGVLNEHGIESAYLRYKTSTKHLEQLSAESAWEGKPHPMPLQITENGLKFLVNIETGQKTGFFLDQKVNRALLQSMSKGKKVLNAFCYTGGFSVYAAAGGAAEVQSVDISKDAVLMCEENMELNFGKVPEHTFIAEDCFDFIRRGDETYDIIVLDPPAFAKNARSVPNACRGYKEINMLAFKKTRPRGLVFTFSCSQNISRELFQKVVFSAAADAGRNVRILKHLTQPYDHPINIFHPESEYLKGLLLYVE